MKQICTFCRILLGIAYLIYGYIHFSHTQADTSMVPNGIGSKTFWVIFIGICWWATAASFLTNILTRLSGFLASILLIFIMLFGILPHFHGVNSWLSLASLLAVVSGSLQVSLQGNMWPIEKKRKNE